MKLTNTRLPILFLCLLLLGSCQRKWKKTTSTTFSFDLNKGQVGPPQFGITSGHILLEQFSFEGERKQGSDVDFQREQHKGYRIDVMTGNVIPGLTFDIPQGTYTHIKTGLRFHNEGSVYDHMIEVWGQYTDASNDVTPVLFLFDQDLNIDLTAKPSEIVLVEDVAKYATIKLDIAGWFGTLTTNQFENATLSSVNGQPTIVISQSLNQVLYESVVNRMGQLESLTFQ